MFECIMKFFSKSSTNPQIISSERLQCKNDLFNKEYRKSYNKLWIDKLRNYHP